SIGGRGAALFHRANVAFSEVAVVAPAVFPEIGPIELFAAANDATVTRSALRALACACAVLLAGPCLAFDLEGHRGTRGLAPENTLAAFRRAIEIGVTTIETDMAVTLDDVVVISHDPFLNPDVVRGPDGHWLGSKGPPIRTLTLAELRRYDIGRLNPASQYAKQFPEQRAVDGERFPQLSELFDLG